MITGLTKDRVPGLAKKLFLLLLSRIGGFTATGSEENKRTHSQ